MGATNCPETPRQKMIGMMYLVLTAMLALNVSKDILDAFATVDETLNISTANFESSISANYSFLDQQMAIFGEAKVGNVIKNAKVLKQKSDELVEYITRMKMDVIFAVDGDTLDKKTQKVKTLREVDSKDNVDKPTNYFINNGNGMKLQEKIMEYKKTLLAMEPDPTRKKILERDLGLVVDKKYKNPKSGNEEDWAVYNFQDAITASSITILDKTIGEVRNAEAVMLSDLKASIGANDFKFDKIEGRTIPKSQMVFTGSNYTTDIIVAAFDTKQIPEVYYGLGRDTATEADIPNLTKVTGENGVVTLEIPAGAVGEKKYAGVIKIKGPDGKDKYYSFKDKFVTSAPSATVLCEYSMIIYAGIDNPVSIGAPVSADKLRVDFGGMPYTKVGDKYQVKPSPSMIGKYVKISVTSVDNGKTTNLGSYDYKIVRVPDPQFLLSGSTGNSISSGDIKSRPFIQSKMPDDFAVKSLRWTISSFDAMVMSNGKTYGPFKSNGPNIPSEILSQVKPKATLLIYNINAKTPAGQSLSQKSSITVMVK